MLPAVLLGACAAPARTPEQDAADLAKWVSRVCSLPPAERKAEQDRLQKEAGITIFCPSGQDEPSAVEEQKQ